MTPTQTALVALVAAVLGGGGLAAVVAKGMFAREYQKAKAGDVKVQAADRVIDILREQIEEDCKECDRRIEALKRELQREREERAAESAGFRARIAQLEMVIQELRKP